jgi:ubiquinone/menaquinone biosynthesis C-methylase UbiE
MQKGAEGQNYGSSIPRYVFENGDERAQFRYRDLSTLYDSQTVTHLTRLGVETGWSCLEVGAGGGSIAAWLCQRVGKPGRVLATDIEPCFLVMLPFGNLQVRRHDVRMEGLPKGEFDLVHARLVLMHLPGRELALERMIEAVKPGGWIVLEEFDALSIFPDVAICPAEEPLRIMRAFYQVMTSRGVEMRYGRRLPQQLQERGLVNIGAEASMSLWQGRSAGTNMFKLSFEELADPILRSGLISQAEFEADIDRLDEQDFLMASPMMWTAWGQVPEFSPYATWLNANSTTEHEHGR